MCIVNTSLFCGLCYFHWLWMYLNGIIKLCKMIRPFADNVPIWWVEERNAEERRWESSRNSNSLITSLTFFIRIFYTLAITSVWDFWQLTLGHGGNGINQIPSNFNDQIFNIIIPLFHLWLFTNVWAFQVALRVTKPPTSTGDVRNACSVPGLGRSAGERNGNMIQCSHLGNPMDRGAWWPTVHSVSKSRTQLKQLSTHKCVTVSERLTRH